MKRAAKRLTLVVSATVGLQQAACGVGVQSPSALPQGGGPIARQTSARPTLASWQPGASVAAQATANFTGPKDAYDFCAAYPAGTAGCALCGHQDFSLDPGQEHVALVDLTQCAGDVAFGHFSVVEYIRGATQVQSLSLRPGGAEYELNVRNASTGQPAPAALTVDRTYTYFANVPDPMILLLSVKRDATSKGGKKKLALVFTSWLPE